MEQNLYLYGFMDKKRMTLRIVKEAFRRKNIYKLGDVGNDGKNQMQNWSTLSIHSHESDNTMLFPLLIFLILILYNPYIIYI